VPNHRSAAKRQRQNENRRARNAAWKSRMRKAVRRARTAIESGAEDREALVKSAVSLVNRARSANVIHASTASRLVARLMGQASKAS